jgi:tRNA-specific 2-thiouridylase
VKLLIVPAVLLSCRVKFGAFVEYLEREHGGSFDRIASGHYACITRPQQQQQQQQQESSQQAETQQLQERMGSHTQASSSSSSSSSSGVVLRLTPDAVKDQTYFLAKRGERRVVNQKGFMLKVMCSSP